MKRIKGIGAVMLIFVCYLVQAQESESARENKKKQNTETDKQNTGQVDEYQGPGFDSPEHNNNQLGHGTTESDDTAGSSEGSDETTEEGISGAPQQDQELLGDSNRKSKNKSGEDDEDSNSNYRNNEVSGNPNNRNVNEGSNRRSGSDNTGEGTGATPAVNPHNTTQGVTNQSSATPADEQEGNSASQDSTNQGEGAQNQQRAADSGTSANPQTTNAPPVLQRTTSGSGSPAVLSGENGKDPDGTNTVQRAQSNMAGAKVNR
jgi:hypothetical protein